MEEKFVEIDDKLILKEDYEKYKKLQEVYNYNYELLDNENLDNTISVEEVTEEMNNAEKELNEIIQKAYLQMNFKEYQDKLILEEYYNEYVKLVYDRDRLYDAMSNNGEYGYTEEMLENDKKDFEKLEERIERIENLSAKNLHVVEINGKYILEKDLDEYNKAVKDRNELYDAISNNGEYGYTEEILKEDKKKFEMLEEKIAEMEKIGEKAFKIYNKKNGVDITKGEPNEGEPKPSEPSLDETELEKSTPEKPNLGESNPEEPNLDEPKSKKPEQERPKSSEPNMGEPKPSEPNQKRRVKFFKTAKEFYKKHRKAILIIGGLALLVAGLPTLIHSFMYLNSVLWGVLVNGPLHLAGEAGLPAFLHTINSTVGTAIHASYDAASGVWTLANGMALNSTACQTGLVASLARLGGGLTFGLGQAGVVAGAVGLAKGTKAAISKAKERLKARKAKGLDTEESLTPLERAKQIINKHKSKFKKPEKEESEEKVFYREDLSEEVNAIINSWIANNLISEEIVEQLSVLPLEECEKLYEKTYKEISENEEIKLTTPENEPKIADEPTINTSLEEPKYYNPNLSEEMNEYLNYKFKYDPESIEAMKTSPTDQIIAFVNSDPGYANFIEQMKEEKGRSK